MKQYISKIKEEAISKLWSKDTVKL